MPEEKVYNILSVDDEVDVSESLKDIIEPHGYRVFTAAGAELAMNILRKETVDLILLDIKMPGINGIELCRRLKEDEILSTIPVIFVSAFYNAKEIKEGYLVGANDFIGKPFIKEELFAKIKVHLKFGELSKIESISGI